MKEKIKELLIIKLGGAAITDKNSEFTPRKEIIKSIMDEISKVNSPTIIIHGAGSFAHTLAKKYQVANGFVSSMDPEEQLTGISLIRNSMQRLHQIILDEAEHNQIRTFSIPISSTLVSKGPDQEEDLFLLPFRKALELGFIPISYGDMSFDSTDAGFRVISGDRIIQLLCKSFSDIDIRVIFGSDVDGLYDRDPKEVGAQLIEKIDLTNIDAWMSVAGESAGIDVTGGMMGKLEQMKQISPYVDRIDLINLTARGRLTKLLHSDDIRQTKFI